MLGRRRGSGGPVVLAVAATLVLAGCSGTSPGADEPAPSDSPETPGSASSPASAATSPRAEPEPPEAPRARRGPAGQEAFAQHVMRSWVWALRHNDARPLLKVSPSRKRPCTGCAALDKELTRRDRKGWHVELPTITVERTRVRREGSLLVATSRVDIPQSDSYYDDGRYRSANPAHEDATFTVRMRQTARGYVLVSFTVS